MTRWILLQIGRLPGRIGDWALDKLYPDPTCDKCGAPITTGAMAIICPHREKCEFWPTDKASQDFVVRFRDCGEGEGT